MKSKFINFLSSINPIGCTYLSIIFTDEENRHIFLNCSYKFNTLTSVPLTLNSCAINLKEMVLRICVKEYDFVYTLAKSYYPITCVEFSNLMIDLYFPCLSKFLQSDCDEKMVDWLFVAHQFLCLYMQHYSVTNIERIYSLSVAEHDISPYTNHLLQEMLRTPTIIIHASLDALSKLINRHLTYRQPVSDMISKALGVLYPPSRNETKTILKILQIPNQPLFVKKPNSITVINIPIYKPAIGRNYSQLVYRVPSSDTSAWMKVFPIVKYFCKEPPNFILC